MDMNGRGKWWFILLLVGLTCAPVALAEEDGATFWGKATLEWLLSLVDLSEPDAAAGTERPIVEQLDDDDKELGPHLEPTG